MKSRLILGSVFLLVSSAAPASNPPPPAAALQAVFVERDDPVIAEIRSIGERGLNWVAGAMVNEATSSIAAHSQADAVRICHLRDLPTGVPISTLPRITAVKRTSLRLRNPVNAPDAAEKLALERVRHDVEAGISPPQLLVQRIDQPDGTREWRVYRPLLVASHCSACHGPAELHSAELRAILQKRYPNDAAVGYSAGEWRGLVRVTVAEAPTAASVPPPTQNSSPAKGAAPKRG